MRILWSPKRWQQSREHQADSGLTPLDEAGQTGEEQDSGEVLLIHSQEEGQQLPILVEAKPAASSYSVDNAEGNKRLVTTAGLIGAGQLLSSTLGFVRIETLNVLFY